MPEVGVDVTTHGSSMVLALNGELDLVTIPSCAARMQEALADHTPVVAVVDLRGMTFCGAQGVRMLRQFAVTCADRAVAMRVVVPAEGIVRRVLSLMPVQHGLRVVEQPGMATAATH